MSLFQAPRAVFRLARSGWLVLLLLSWATLLFLPLIYFSVYPGRDEYLALGKEIGWKTFFFQGSRGQILDRDGKPLSWTERNFSLTLSQNLSPERRQIIRNALSVIFMEKIPELPEQPGAIRNNLKSSEIHRFAAIRQQFPELKLQSHSTRIHVRPELKAYVGEIREKNGVISGISGLEKLYDRQLRGKIGFFTVMTGKNGQWVADTWQQLKKPESGCDIKIENTLDELLSGTVSRALNHERN